MGQHFNLPNHSISDMILQGIEALAAGNRSVSAEKRCGSSVSTPFTPMVSTFRKGMTNSPFFSSFFFFPHRNYLHLFYIYVYICSTFVLFLQHKLLVPLFTFNLLCVVTGPAPDSAFYIFFFRVHFTPD